MITLRRLFDVVKADGPNISHYEAALSRNSGVRTIDSTPVPNAALRNEEMIPAAGRAAAYYSAAGSS